MPPTTLLASAPSLLASTPEIWRSLISHAPADLIERAPTPGAWSARACLVHLVETERWVFPVRVRALLAGQDFAGFDPDSQGTIEPTETPTADLLAEFSALRAQNVAVVAALQPTDLPRTVRHADLGMVTLAELLHEWVAHDLMHTVQAARALMQPYIAGCGPWQPYFRDHLAQ